MQLVGSIRQRGMLVLAAAMTAAVAVFAIGGASPAAAAPNTVWSQYDGAGSLGGAASARFSEVSPEAVYLCDHASDGHGVGVRVQWDGEDGERHEEWFWFSGGGPGGNWPTPDDYNCETNKIGVAEGTIVEMMVCNADHTTPGGKTPDKIEATCSEEGLFVNDNSW